MGVAVGFILIAIAVVWIVYKLYVSFNSGGGTSMMVPVYDAAIYPPPLAAVGLYLVLPFFGVDWPLWALVVVWIALTALTAGAIRLAEEVGDRPL